MNDTTLQPRSTIFCLTGILASLLLIIGFLGEGNARTFSDSQDRPTQIREPYSDWDLTPRHSFHSPIHEESQAKQIQVHQISTPKDNQEEKERIDKKDQPLKKRMGLALLFLGILAEEG